MLSGVYLPLFFDVILLRYKREQILFSEEICGALVCRLEATVLYREEACKVILGEIGILVVVSGELIVWNRQSLTQKQSTSNGSHGPIFSERRTEHHLCKKNIRERNPFASTDVKAQLGRNVGEVSVKPL